MSLTKSVYYIIYVYMDAGRGAWRRSGGKYDLEKSHPHNTNPGRHNFGFRIMVGGGDSERRTKKQRRAQSHSVALPEEAIGCVCEHATLRLLDFFHLKE